MQYAAITEGHEDPLTGDLIPGVTTWGEHIKCRYESNGKAMEMEMPNGDGTVRKYAYVVYLNLDNTKDYLLGEYIRLFDQRGVMVAQKQVLGFERGQLNARLWV